MQDLKFDRVLKFKRVLGNFRSLQQKVDTENGNENLGNRGQ